MHKTVILILFFAFSMNVAAQEVENVFGSDDDSVYLEEEAVDNFIQPDTVLIKNANFIHPDSIAAIKKKKEFAYVPRMDSLLKAESSPTNRKVNTSLSLVERFLNSAFFRFFIWFIPIGLLLIVLYNFLRSQGTFNKKTKSRVQEESEDDVQNTTHDYLALARAASGSGEYRPAVKYLFLRTLQQLAAAGFINYASDKTNYNYVQEIDSDKRKEFSRLVLNYEYVWYGNSIPERPLYNQIENEFISFLDKYNLN